MTGAAQRTASLLIGGAVLALAGCGGGGGTATSPAGMRVQREDLIAVAHALAGAEREVAQEVKTTRAAWPHVADGLPASADTVSQPLIRAAAEQAAALKVPAVFEEHTAGSLTGPASGVAGLFRGFAGLAGRGWQLIGGAVDEIGHGSPRVARFARANSPLYVESVYDAHFGLAQIGKRLLSAYNDLGGPEAFGAALTESEVSRLAQAYSEARDRLHPHPALKLGS